MVTNYPRQLTAAETIGTADPLDSGMPSGLMARMVSRLGQAVCGLSGHDPVLHFEGRRVMMRCTSCGHDSPGWEVSDRSPRLRFEGDARRHRMSRDRHVALRRPA